MVGFGPAETSSCTALSVHPAWIADVNNYYRDLGVHPRATRKDLREAYFARNGQESERLTYVMKQLLDPQIRRAYDETPLGSTFVDKYVQEEVHRRVQEAARQRMIREGRDLLDGALAASYEEEIYRQAGLLTESEEPLDALSGKVQTDLSHPAGFPYSYYLWGPCVGDHQVQQETLARWQEHLVRAFARRGVSTRFAVGIYDRMKWSWAMARVGYREVFFLHHLETPTADLAERLASEWFTTHHPSLRER